MNNKENILAMYERQLELTLQRVDPQKYGFDKKRKIHNRRFGAPYQITPRNRELLLKRYENGKTDGLSIPRLAVITRVYGKLFENLDKDFDKCTRDDIEKLVAKINSMHITPVTRQDYLKKIKQFDKWLNGGEECSERTRWIKTGLGKKHTKLPSQLVTPKEVEQLLDVTEHPRDRALIHLMWESGARIGEIINLQVNSIEFMEGEARIRLRGKVGERQVLLLESVRDLKEFYKTRNTANPEEPLFTLIGNKNKGQPLTYCAVSKILRTLKAKTTIKKHIHAYLFRHSRASYLASQGLNEAQMCMIFGWTIGSKQPATYIHLSGSQTETAYKKLYGIVKEEKKDKLIQCSVCGEVNPSSENTCKNCFNPLTIQGALKVKQENEELVKATKFMQELKALSFEYIQKGNSVEQAQVLAMQKLVEKGKEERTEQQLKALA